MNFNPNNQNTLLTKKVAALYEAMQKAGDSGLAFMVVDSLNSLANYARFLAEQEILIQQARITMDAASYRIFYHSVDSARTSLLENAAANVALLNRLCKKYNTDQIAGNVADAIEAEMNSGNMYSLANSPAYTAFAKEVLNTYYTTGSAGSICNKYINPSPLRGPHCGGGALMFKVLGGIGRSVPLYNGKARILVKAIIPAAPKCLAEMQSICEANGWKSVLDERGNLVVLSVVSIDAYRLSDSTLMTAYLRFAETAAQKLTGCKNRYLVAGVVSYDAAA